MPQDVAGRGKLVFLPESFLRTRSQVKAVRRQRNPMPNLVDALKRRDLIESAEEAARTSILFAEFRRRRRVVATAALDPPDLTFVGQLSGEKPPPPPSRAAPLCVRVVRTTELSYWNVPSCRIWVQDLGSGEQWVVARTLAEVAELSQQIQALEDAARDDEIAEAALAAASKEAATSPGDEREGGINDNGDLRVGQERGYDNDAEGRWKLEDVVNFAEAREEKERKGQLLKYLLSQTGSSNNNTAPSTHSLGEGRIRTSSEGSNVATENDQVGDEKDGGEVEGGDDSDFEDLEDWGLGLDLDETGSAGGLSISFDDSRFLVGSPVGGGGENGRGGSGSASLLSPRGGNGVGMLSTQLSPWRSPVMPGVVPVEEAQEKTERLLRRVAVANSFFDPTLRLKPAPPESSESLVLPQRRRIGGGGDPSVTADEADKVGGVTSSRRGACDHEFRRSRRMALRRRARRKEAVAAQAAAAITAWVGEAPPPSLFRTTPAAFDNELGGDAGRNSTGDAGFLSLSSSLAMSLPMGLSLPAEELHALTASPEVAVSLQSSLSKPSVTPPLSSLQDDLIREIRIYTMGVLSLPPLARLVEAYVRMVAQELDAILGTDSNPDTAAAAATAPAGAGDTHHPTSLFGLVLAPSAATSLVSSLFGSLMAPALSPTPPPPLPPPSPPPAHPQDAVHIKNYWDDSEEDEEGGEDEDAEGGNGGARTSYMVVVRKAKVREGVEIKHHDQKALSSAALVGTLGEGTVVVVLEEAVARDGTLRSKVRTVLDFEQGVQAASRCMVVGWVTSTLLRPSRPPQSPSSSRGSTLSRGGSCRGGSEGRQEPDTQDQARLGVFNGTRVVGSDGHERKFDEEGFPLSLEGASLSADEGSPDDTTETEYECGGGPVHELMERVASFVAQTVYLIKDACEADLYSVVARHAATCLDGDQGEGVVDGGVWRQVEAEVVVPLHDKLASAIAREVKFEASKTAKRLRALKALPQEFWSIPRHLTSPTSWAEAVKVLNLIPSAILPSDKVDLLLQAVQTIEQLSEEEPVANEFALTETQTDATKPLGADELFPIFVYVLVQSELWKQGEMVCLRELLSGLANPERQRWSASAYYVATLEAAIEHIKAT